MDQHPYGIPRPTAPYRPPMTGGLRLLLTLTAVSFAVSVLNSILDAFAGPTGSGPSGAVLTSIALLLGLVLTAGLYALVWFPLREQRQWGWTVGLVLCSLGILGDAFTLLAHLLGGQLLPGLSTTALLSVDIAWLVAATRPGVRAALR